MKINAYQKLAFYYNDIYNSDFYYRYAFFVKNIIKRNKITNPVILDFACGTGRLITELVKNGISKNNGVFIFDFNTIYKKAKEEVMKSNGVD